MFNNIGRKIKGLAMIIGIGGAIFCVLAALQIVSAGLGEFSSVFIPLAILSIVSSWPLYGFGQLIESVMSIEEMMKPSNVLKFK